MKNPEIRQPNKNLRLSAFSNQGYFSSQRVFLSGEHYPASAIKPRRRVTLPNLGLDRFPVDRSQEHFHRGGMG